MDEMYDDGMRRQWQWQLRWEWRQQLPELLAGNVIEPTLQLQQKSSSIGSTWLPHFLTTSFLHLGERFDAVTVQASRLLALVPSVMNENQTKSQELQGVVDMYRDDLPSPQLFPAEFQRWRIKYAEEEELPGSCATALKQCDEDEFPNIFTLLKYDTLCP